MKFEEFLKPKLVGGRFEGEVQAIPLEFLRDLSVLNKMIQEGARAEFLKANPDRQRSPHGFTDDLTLVLTRIDEGCVIPVIALMFEGIGLFPNPQHIAYYEQARDAIIGAIGAAEANGTPTDFLTPKSLSHFKSFGDRLRDGEAIEFPTGIPNAPARLTKETRRRLLLASPGVEEVSEEVELRGLVQVTNQGERKFQIKLADGSEVAGSIVSDHYDRIIEATAGYRQGRKLFLRGIGIRDRQGRLLRVEEIEHSDVLDPLDIPARFEELRLFEDGWLDGDGFAPAADGLKWLEVAIRNHYPVNLPLPRIYPAPEGTLVFEWSIGTQEASLEVDLSKRTGYWHVLNLANGEDQEVLLNLDEVEGWAVLGKRFSELMGGTAG